MNISLIGTIQTNFADNLVHNVRYFVSATNILFAVASRFVKFFIESKFPFGAVSNRTSITNQAQLFSLAHSTTAHRSGNVANLRRAEGIGELRRGSEERLPMQYQG